MGFRRWWQDRQARTKAVRLSLRMNSDPALIASQVPELAGMGEAQGMAHVLQQVSLWKAGASPEQVAEFSRRGNASMESFEREGLTMPYWGSLLVLRTYQAELGLSVPPVSRPGSGVPTNLERE